MHPTTVSRHFVYILLLFFHKRDVILLSPHCRRGAEIVESRFLTQSIYGVGKLLTWKFLIHSSNSLFKRY